MVVLKSAPIRVCFLIDRLGVAGTESQLRMLIKYLDRSHIEPFLCLLDGSDPAGRSLEPANCTVMRLGVRRLRSPSTLVQAWRFGKFLRKNRIDVVQTHFPDSTYFGILAGRLARVSKIVSTRRNIGHWLTPGHRRASRIAARRVDAIIANCQACRRAVIEQEGADPDRVYVIPNGIEFKRFEDVRPYQPRPHENGLRVGMLANLRPVKGPDLLVRAAAMIVRKYPNVEFELAGGGDQVWIRQIISECGLGGRLRLLGPIDHIPDWLGTLDVAVLASRAEGLSNALLEYMAAGRPIVATRVGGNIEIIDDDVTGLLVEPEEPEDLAVAISELLGDGERRCRLGEAARKAAHEYAAVNMNTAYHQLVSQIVNPSRREM